MNIEINAVELASELASDRVFRELKRTFPSLSDNEIWVLLLEDRDESNLQWKEESQRSFNSYYDEFLEIINKCKTK